MSESSRKKTTRDFLRTVFRYKWLFVFGTVTFVIVAMFTVQEVMPVKYMASTKFQRRSDIAAAGRSSNAPFEEDKLTLRHDLAGRHAVAQVAEELGLLKGLPHDADGQLTRVGQMSKARIVNELMASISIGWDVRTKKIDLVTVSFVHEEPKLAQRVPDALVSRYINRISERIVERLTYSRKFLDEQVKAANIRLKELRDRKLEFETEHANAMPENASALAQRIQDISSDIDTLRTRQEVAKMTLVRLEKLRSAPKPTSRPATQPAMEMVNVPNPELLRLQEQFRGLEEALRTELIQKTEKHPTIVSLRERMAVLAGRIANTPPEVAVEREKAPDPDAENEKPLDEKALEAHMAAASSELDTTAREIQRQQKRLEPLLTLMKNFAPIRQEYLAMMENVKREEGELNTWRRRHAEVQMDLAAEVAKRRTHLNAVQAAQEPQTPSSPSLRMVLAGPIVGGFVFGAALVFLATMVDRSVATVEDANHRFHLPIHGIISQIVSTRGRLAKALKNWVLLPGATGILVFLLGLSSMSVVLWLRYPEKYVAWQEDPPAFIVDTASKLVNQFPGLD